MRRLGKFFRLSGGEKRRFVEAAVWLTVFRVAVSCVPFRVIAGLLGRERGETAVAFPDPAGRGEVLAVARALKVMGRSLPWESTCLVKAAAGKRMLSCRSIPATLYLGVARDDVNAVAAHAWLRSGDVILTGAEERDRYTVICTFA